MVAVIRQHIEIAQGQAGPKPGIVGHGTRVQDIAIWHEQLGLSPDEIVHNQPTTTLADVHAALAYCWDHRDEIERAITAERVLAREIGDGMSGLVLDNPQ